MTNYADSRTPIDKYVDAAILERVREGITLLTKTHGPDWVDKVDLDTLRLSSSTMCVLGQVYAEEARFLSNGVTREGYEVGVEMLGIVGSNYGFDTNDEGDSYNELQEAWEHELSEIKERRSSDE